MLLTVYTYPSFTSRFPKPQEPDITIGYIKNKSRHFNNYTVKKLSLLYIKSVTVFSSQNHFIHRSLIHTAQFNTNIMTHNKFTLFKICMSPHFYKRTSDNGTHTHA